jgi:hypothetical protein
MERRRALRLLGAIATLPALEALRRADVAELGAHVHDVLRIRGVYDPRAMSPAQYAIVTLAAERIIPRTDTPGVTDVRVADFIDTMLADWYDPADRDRFLAGVDALDNRSQLTCATGFAECTPAQQTSLLAEHDTAVAELRATDERAANEHWFGMLKFLTVWGYYTSQPGIEQELHEQFLPGYYKGDVPYATPAAENPGGR